MAHFQVQIGVGHVQGGDNVAADALSCNDIPRFLQVVPDAVKHTAITLELVDLLVREQLDLDLILLGPTVQRLLQVGVALLTHRAYTAGKRKYPTFCKETGTPPIPVTKQDMMHFKGLGYTTVKSYLSAIWLLQASAGGGDPKVSNMPLVALMLRGARSLVNFTCPLHHPS